MGWGSCPWSVNARLFICWSTWDRLPCECLDALKWMHFISSVVTAQSWLAASQCIWVCWIFLEGWRGGSSAFQVSQTLMCLAGLAGGPGSRWADGHYPASHGQGLSSRLVRALRDQGPPSSDKKVRCVLGCFPGEASGSQRPGFGNEFQGWCAAHCIAQNDPSVLACVGFGAVHCSQNVRFPGHQGRLETLMECVMVQWGRFGLQTITKHLSWEAISIVTVWWIQVCILKACEDTSMLVLFVEEMLIIKLAFCDKNHLFHWKLWATRNIMLYLVGWEEKCPVL